MKRIAILGSTGSIGRNTLEIVRNSKGKFKVVALSSNTNADELKCQVREFKPACACLTDKSAASSLKLKSQTKFFFGPDGLEQIIRLSRADLIVLAISGSAGLRPLLSAIAAKIDVALANKESLVMAGPLVMRKAQERAVKIIPIDSEQSAIWQCLEGQEKDKLKTVYLTASGGPFRNTPFLRLKRVSLDQVLKHPRWRMGKKITVDSATLMNKGLEVLEAMYLFGLDHKKIKVVVHPQAIIHSMVEFIDGVVLAQLSVTDMRIPIQYAMSYPGRLKNYCKRLDFYRLKELSFEKPDLSKFRCLALALRSASQGGTLPCIMNAANEVSVEHFLKRKLSFLSIPEVIEKTMDLHRLIKHPELSDIWEADRWGREVALKFIRRLN